MTNRDLRRKGDKLARANSQLKSENRHLVGANRRLVQARDAALAASELKSLYVANVSHEIRTSMSGILGFTEIVLDTDLSGDQRENLTIVKNSAESLLDLLNDILDLSKVEAGKLEVETVKFSLRDLLHQTLEPIKIRAASRSLNFLCHVDDRVPEALMGDPGRLRQVLTNLAANAVKFTASGQVEIRAEALDRDDATALVRFSVADTGIGIPVEKQALIFEAFRQAERTTSRRYGGTGLGLSISARLVELMGGKLVVNSESGQGSTFSFTLSMADAGCRSLSFPAAPPCPVHTGEALRCRILLVEDHPVNQRLALQLLDKLGHDVTVASNGLEALAIYRQGFDLVLMDVQMPEMDGIVATRAIRGQERGSGRHLPIVAMTAHALKGD